MRPSRPPGRDGDRVHCQTPCLLRSRSAALVVERSPHWLAGSESVGSVPSATRMRSGKAKKAGRRPRPGLISRSIPASQSRLRIRRAVGSEDSIRSANVAVEKTGCSPPHVGADRAVADAQRRSDPPVAALKLVLQAQDFPNARHGQLLLSHRLPPSLEGPLPGRKKALATKGRPAPLLNHCRVDDMRRNHRTTCVGMSGRHASESALQKLVATVGDLSHGKRLGRSGAMLCRPRHVRLGEMPAMIPPELKIQLMLPTD